MEPTPERYQRYLEISNRLSGELDRLNADTAFSINVGTMTKHPSFLSLAGMGERIVPFLVYHMSHHGAGWHHILLLNHIMGMGIHENRYQGSFYGQLGSWLLWYEDHRDLFRDDIYHGLIDG